MIVNPFYELVAIIISIIIVLYYGTSKKISSVQNKVFVLLNVANLLTALTDILTYYFVYTKTSLVACFVCSDIYFVTHILVIPLLLLYIFFSARDWRSYSLVSKVLSSIPFAAMIALVIYNKFNPVLYTYNSDFIYSRGVAMPCLYFGIAFYVLYALVFLFKFKKEIPSIKRAIIMIALTCNVVSVYIQFISYETRIETFAISFSLLLMFLTIQDPHSEKDFETNLYNKNAFMSLMKQSVNSLSKHIIITIVIRDFVDFARESDNQINTMGAEIGHYLEGVSKSCEIFRYEKNVFIMHMMDASDSVIEAVVDEVKSRFKEPWQFSDINIVYKIGICRLDIPTEIDNITRLSGILHNFSSWEADRTYANDKYASLGDFDLKLIDRSTKIKDAVMKAVETDSFELIFSPIYSMENKKNASAIVSYRFLDDEIGYVYAKEMIPILERQGVLNDVIKKINNKIINFYKNEFNSCNIKSIVLKVVSPMTIQAGYLNELFDLMKENNIPSDYLCIEITEYIVSKSKNKLIELMETRSKEGFTFILSEYGSGYSNMSAIYDIPISGLTVDGNVVRAAFENKRARVALINTLQLARKLNLITALSGITDLKYFNMLQYFSCDYAFGSYFMEDLDVNDFINLGKQDKEVTEND